ncbi:39S ribosomal protein L37, mitochondrial [Pangasianodon hypophthalmus]|uniref:39S ribosomal protein L37, mitochondrial n=1 Tax=Pangasianodon hypophthalmus TaxID=310915 RepID=UPI00230705FE|nr:39S ribosomal protein L37, mitochondrial [Pangasianodon hypophthalmus]
MFSATVRRLALSRRMKLSAEGEPLHRCLALSSCACGKTLPRKKPRELPEIQGLERITYAERKHYVPGLAKPRFPDWEKDWHDPGRYRAPAAETMELYKQRPCYIYSQRTNPLEGVRQALWLTKTKLISGFPAQLLALAENPANQLEDQDERVQNAIRHARFWDTNELRPPKERYCPSLLHNLLHLCRGLQVSHPALGHRMLAEKYILSASWSRGEDQFQVRGQNGFLLNSTTPLPAVAGDEEVRSTSDHVLETFYPISPTIDLQCAHVYQLQNHTGFREDYPYPHVHTLFVMEAGDAPKLQPEQLRAKLIMFAFGNALARARALYGNESRVLEKPIVVQSVGTNGRLFQFVVFQLNTTDLESDSGVKNLAWVDADQQLYDFAKVRPFIKKKVVKVPAGLSGYQPETFKKFLALYLHGAAN